MSRRGWTNEYVAQDGWRGPVSLPTSPTSRHPVHPARQQPGYPPSASGYSYPQQPGATARPFSQRSALPVQPPQPVSSSAMDGNRNHPEQPRIPGPDAAPVRSNGVSNQTGLWWLRSRAPTYDGARSPAPVAQSLSAFEGQLHDLTSQIETLRHQSAGSGHGPDAGPTEPPRHRRSPGAGGPVPRDRSP